MITSFNKASEKLLGYSSDEVIGKLTPKVFHLADEVLKRAKKFTQQLNQKVDPDFEVFVIKSKMGLANTYEWTYVKKDGSHIPVLLSVTAIQNDSGNITGYMGIAADISNRKKSELAIIDHQQKLNEAQRIAKIGSWSLDLKNNHLEWSDEIFRLFEINRKLFKASYEAFIEAIHPDDRELVNNAYQDSLKNRQPYEITHRLKFPDGRIKYVHEACETLFAKDGTPLLSQGTVQDITEKKKAEEKIALFANVFKHSSEAILISDSRNRIIAVNPALEKLTGYSEDELLGQNPRILTCSKTPKETLRNMLETLNKTNHWQGELIDRRKDGQLYYKWLSISVIKNKLGEIQNYIATFTDISERKEAEEKITYLAHHDALTGLINRMSFEERLEQSIFTARREKQYLAVLFIDMDKFKDINDSKGHDVGDALLVEVSRRLKKSVRESDIVARLGGDEFVVALTALDDKMLSLPIATYIVHHLGQPYKLSEHIIHTSPSVGISIFPDNGDTVTSLLKHADTAMYHAKEKGRNNLQFFDEKMNEAISERIKLESELREAIKKEQFVLHYQPKIEANTSKPIGFEVLVRWQHPERGLIYPDTFIPAAEKLKLINPLGDWILKESCQQLSEWQTNGLKNIKLAVNLSLQQLQEDNFVEKINELIKTHHIKPESLELEITESIAMHDPEMVIKKLSELKNIGVKLAIDDFGTGYSSLIYLKKLPVDTLKIDRAFIMELESDKSDAQIVTATIALSHNLGIAVVAEGVENKYQRDFLCYQQCDYLQGYYFSKPMPIHEAMEYMQKHIA